MQTVTLIADITTADVTTVEETVVTPGDNLVSTSAKFTLLSTNSNVVAAL